MVLPLLSFACSFSMEQSKPIITNSPHADEYFKKIQESIEDYEEVKSHPYFKEQRLEDMPCNQGRVLEGNDAKPWEFVIKKRAVKNAYHLGKNKIAYKDGSFFVLPEDKEPVEVKDAHIKTKFESYVKQNKWLSSAIIKQSIKKGSHFDLDKFPNGQYYLALKGKMGGTGYVLGEIMYWGTWGIALGTTALFGYQVVKTLDNIDSHLEKGVEKTMGGVRHAAQAVGSIVPLVEPYSTVLLNAVESIGESKPSTLKSDMTTTTHSPIQPYEDIAQSFKNGDLSYNEKNQIVDKNGNEYYIKEGSFGHKTLHDAKGREIIHPAPGEIPHSFNSAETKAKVRNVKHEVMLHIKTASGAVETIVCDANSELAKAIIKQHVPSNYIGYIDALKVIDKRINDNGINTEQVTKTVAATTGLGLGAAAISLPEETLTKVAEHVGQAISTGAMAVYNGEVLATVEVVAQTARTAGRWITIPYLPWL